MLDALVHSHPGLILLSSVLVRRDCAIACGGFDPKITMCEDYDFLLRIATAHSFGFVAEPLTIYRRHDKAVSAGKVLLVRSARVAVLDGFIAASKPRLKLRQKYSGHVARTHLLCARQALLLGDEEKVRFHIGRAIAWGPRDPKALMYGLACLGSKPGLRALAAVVRHREMGNTITGSLF
jgi:hypothetical protein